MTWPNAAPASTTDQRQARQAHLAQREQQRHAEHEEEAPEGAAHGVGRQRHGGDRHHAERGEQGRLGRSLGVARQPGAGHADRGERHVGDDLDRVVLVGRRLPEEQGQHDPGDDEGQQVEARAAAGRRARSGRARYCATRKMAPTVTATGLAKPATPMSRAAARGAGRRRPPTRPAHGERQGEQERVLAVGQVDGQHDGEGDGRQHARHVVDAPHVGVEQDRAAPPPRRPPARCS